MTADNDNIRDTSPTARCPNCGTPTVSQYRPFCSGRCKDVDLSRWLSGAYAIPGNTADDDEDGENAALEIDRRKRAGDDDGPQQ